MRRVGQLPAPTLTVHWHWHCIASHRIAVSVRWIMSHQDGVAGPLLGDSGCHQRLAVHQVSTLGLSPVALFACDLLKQVSGSRRKPASENLP